MDRIYLLRPGETKKVADHPELLVLMMALSALEATRNWLNLLARTEDSLSASDFMFASATNMASAAEAILRLKDTRLKAAQELAYRKSDTKELWDQLVTTGTAIAPIRAHLKRLFAVRDKYVAHWDFDEAKAFLAKNGDTLERVPLVEEMQVGGRQFRFPWALLALKTHLFGDGLETDSIRAEAPEYARIVGSITNLLARLIEGLMAEIGLRGDWGEAAETRIP